MRTTLLLTLGLSATLWAQDIGKRVVESPVKKNLGPAPEKFDLARTGISWTEGLGSALDKGKPILLFQLLGKFDDTYC
jgi:hypothetical protein